ncbi:hypothetical protein PROFUN_08367 [Planoprotostelium fungivorum]|uniref:Uncharacterized protein n=1 Tax=Planoprotostelium fungivorum TaxID=1890364 RepID=A0A2P6NJP6_9EUKA|nr:hypothetical protein PROFUN_08367 [Planoprotostelium fungivorum]
MTDALHLPEIECEMSFGRDNYILYFPVEIGDFVLNFWARPNLKGSQPVFSLTLFENGSRVNGRDSRWKKCPWANKLFRSWGEETFTREEIDTIIGDVKDIAEEQEWS